jgi:hypothetical protein
MTEATDPPPTNAIFSDQPLDFRPPSLFLAGPTPRREGVKSWRPEAILVLKRLGFVGTVLVPERRDRAARFSYMDQVEWEFAALEAATALAFWAPRDLDALPGFTTNVEFGRYVGSGRCVYGRPDGAPHTRYLDWLYHKLTGRLPENALEATLRAAVELAERRTPGRGGSRGTRADDAGGASLSRASAAATPRPPSG